MASKNASFEMQSLKEGRWITETVFPSEDAALAGAKKRLADKKCEGARVIRNWLRADGMTIETTIFSETRTVREEENLRISQIDEAPPKCESPKEFSGTQSRNVMNRLFRNYMEKAFITPTELIHNYKELKRLQDKDNLLPNAVDRVASLQTREGGQDSRERRNEIYEHIEEIAAQARDVEKMNLPKITGSFKEMYDQLQSVSSKQDPDYLSMVVLSRDLLNARSWVGKLERLCRLAVAEGDPHSIALLDGVICDVLGANVVQDILGSQPHLGQAIIHMLDLAEGAMPTQKSDAGESAEMLNKLLGASKLPQSRECLLDRAHKQLRSSNALCRNDPSREWDVFKLVMARMVNGNGLACGKLSAEALTTRYGRFGEKGGAAGRRDAIMGCFNAMPDRAVGLMYLCYLAETEYAREHANDIVECVQLVTKARNLDLLCQRGIPAKERMQRATNAHRIASASVFPPQIKGPTLEHIDLVLDKYLSEAQIIEKLDHNDSSLRERAVRLVQFCGSGVLPEGRAMNRARHRILDLLRQPNFDARFVEGITDPMVAQKTLREFHQLLVLAGFGR